jgi:hypothetical protein
MVKNYDYVATSLNLGAITSCNQREASQSTRRLNWLSYVSLFLMLLSFALTQAQSTANYAFSTNTSGSLALDSNGNAIDLTAGATALVAAASDQGVSAVTNIGFNYIFNGVLFTQFTASANGVMQLGGTAVSGSTYVTSGGTVALPKLSAISSDAITASVADGGGITSKLIGTAPNRCLVVQWVSYLYWLNTASPATFQVRLYETTGVVEYVYGAMPVGSGIYSSGYTTGFSVGTAANQLASVATSTNAVSYTAFTANMYTAATNITNLHSTTNGSRTIYRFTPPSTVAGDVSTLTFTAVTANTTTVNFVDNATNETGFLVLRATDAAFTQNISISSVASTTSAGTGTAYTSVQTGLSAGTNYFYKIVAVVEGGQSVGITGNQITLIGLTYYWVGATGGLWNTFANWNTAADGTGTTPTAWATSDVHVIDGAGTIPGGALDISVDRATFTLGQIKITSNTSLTLASSATTTRVITISGGPNHDFVLEAGSTLNLTNATNAISFAFTGAGNTGIIAGSYIASGAIANTINTTGGTGTLFSITGIGSVVNSLNSSSGCITGTVASLLFENGTNYSQSNSTTINYIPTATWQINATATLNGNTTGTSLTSASPSLGNLIINTTLSTATLSAFTSNVRTILGDLTINSTGTGRFRAITSGVLQINGNLFINGGTFEVGSSTGGGVIVKGTTTVGSGGVLDVNRSTLQNEGNMVNNGSVLSSELTTTSTSTINFIGTAGLAQTFSGSGTFTGRVSSFGVSNPLGVTLTTPVLVQRVNLFTGLITGSSNVTLGTGLALPGVVQIGTAANTTSGGSFDVSPTFNLGTGTYTILYSGETTPRTTGFEIPSSRSITNLILDNTNGLVISGGTVEVTGGLTLTNGIVTATIANHIIHGSATAAGVLTGGSATSYINGPIVRTINDANTGYVLFPVGKTQYAPVFLAPTTTSVSKFRAETFPTNSGTANASITSLATNRRWEAPLVSGTFTDINVRIGDANLVATNIPVHATTAAGEYTSAFGSTATFVAGTPNTVQSNAAAASANYFGFLSYAVSNACAGTPAPGATTSTASTICLGQSITLGLTTIPAGSGITYQWQSSTDGGATYADITGANGTTYTVAPTQVTFYRCNVTCTTGPASAFSTPIQITYTNSVVTNTPASRCGTGTVVLGATGNVGATVSWYAAASGGAALANGESFTTPVIDATTTYFASANSASPGAITLGLGATTSSTVNSSFLPGGWGGTKTQYILKASELQAAGIAAGPITSLGFEPTTSGQTYQGFFVYAGLTTDVVAPSATFIPNSNLSFVYSGTQADNGFTPVANTVNNLTFGTGTGTVSSLVWDGTSNIILSISWSRVPGATTATASSMKGDNVGFVSSAYRQRDNVTPLAMSDEAVVNTTSSNRPSFTINGQVVCSSPRVAVVASVVAPPTLTLSTNTTTICNGSTSAAVTLTAGATDYDTFVWTPSTGVSGNSTTGWTFNPMMTTSYVLTASQSAGSLCSTNVSLNVTVNAVPSAVTVSPAATICTNTIATLSATGGTISNLTILSQDFNAATNNWTTTNNSTGGTPANIAWTLTLSPFDYSFYGTFSSNDATQFYLSNNDAGGSGSSANTALTSPSFSTVNLTNATVSFWHYFRNPGDAKVEYSVNGGTSWNIVQTFTTTVGAVGAFVQENVVLPAGALNQATVQVRFKYDTVGWQYFWALDNVTISGTQSTSIVWSPVTNLFTDAAATIAYTGTSAATVYYKSATASAATTYTATATSAANCSASGTTTVTNVDCEIQYANLQFPGTSTINTCGSETFYAKVYKAGVTEPAGQGAGITAWIGRNTTNTDPSTWAESSWQLATFNVQSGNDDEYQATFSNLAAGTYYVASRFVFTPGTFVYGGYTATGGGFWGGSNVSAVLTVNAVAQPTASSQTFCNGATVANLVATGSNLQWYAASTGGSALASNTALATGNYYVSQTVSGCESMRTLVAVTVNVTAAPTATSPQSFVAPATIANIVINGSGTIIWYPTLAHANANTNALPTSTALVDNTTYYATQTVNGCPSSAIGVLVNVTLRNTGFDSKSLTYYPNPTRDVITFEYSNTITNLRVINMLGQEVSTRKYNSTSAQLDMNGLASGTYIIEITSEGFVTQVKVVKAD